MLKDLVKQIQKINELVTDNEIGKNNNLILENLLALNSNLKQLQTDYSSLIMKDPETFKWEIVTVDDIIYGFAEDLEENKVDELRSLIISNKEKIKFKEIESLLYIIQDRHSLEEIFVNCPEIIDFINKNTTYEE